VVWQAETIHCRLQLWTQTIRELVGLYRVICGPLNVICGTVLALYRVMCGPVNAHKFVMCGVMCGDVRFSGTPSLVLSVGVSRLNEYGVREISKAKWA